MGKQKQSFLCAEVLYGCALPDDAGIVIVAYRRLSLSSAPYLKARAENLKTWMCFLRSQVKTARSLTGIVFPGERTGHVILPSRGNTSTPFYVISYQLRKSFPTSGGGLLMHSYLMSEHRVGVTCGSSLVICFLHRHPPQKHLILILENFSPASFNK
jgi:hypothetical protein